MRTKSASNSSGGAAIRRRLPAPLGRRALGLVERLRFLALEKPTLDPKLRRELLEVYRDDIARLETLIGRDLSAWLR